MDFTAGKIFTAPPPPPTDSGTAAIMLVESLATSTGMKLEKLKTVAYYLNRVRDRLAIAGTDKSATPMVEIDEVLDAFVAHAKMFRSKLTANPMEDRMLALEKVVKESLEKPVCKTAPQPAPLMGGRPTYASIVAPPATKAAVRIRVEGANKMQPAELLNKAKLHINGAYAVRQLRSNDTEVFVQSVSQRDAALRMAQPKEFCVLKQDYPVEILGVPLGTIIHGGKNANNSVAIFKMTTETKARIPGIQINRVRWLYDGKEHTWVKENGHTRGSVIASLPTEALQREVIRNGIVMDSMLYTAQLWSPRAQVKQCFNCSQWGHTQASCNKARKCGGCAGTHQTRDCPKKSVLCCNCGKAHLSWQKGACPSFAAYKANVQRARYGLMERTAELRRESETLTELPQLNTANIPDDHGFTLVTNQKPEGFKRGPGRPRKQVQVPAPSQHLFAPSGSKSRPQPSLFGTRGQGKDGEVYFS